MSQQTFSSDTLLQQLRCFPAPQCYQVAVSGGLDSVVLLHALCALRESIGIQVAAVHVHHGLQDDADQWAAHCQRLCVALGVEFERLSVDARPARGESPEAAARGARYRALRAWLPAGHCLLTAHHQDDQAETLLLQLLRGAGVSGLAAMPVETRFGRARHIRPLLAVTRAALQTYATDNTLQWVDDPSNTCLDYDRNYLRHRVMPLLRERWPAVAASLSRSAAHCAQANDLINEFAGKDFAGAGGSQSGTLSAAVLLQLSSARHTQVLRRWLKQCADRVPSTAVLERIVNDVLHSRIDASPCVRWGQHEVRRYRDDIYCLPQHEAINSNAELSWTLSEPLALPHAAGVLTATAARGAGLRASAVNERDVRVVWRQGGERCQPVGSRVHHSLKKLYQAAGIPPWQRNRIPLLYLDDQLAVVPGLWLCEPFQAGPGEQGLLIDWQPDTDG